MTWFIVYCLKCNKLLAHITNMPALIDKQKEEPNLKTIDFGNAVTRDSLLEWFKWNDEKHKQEIAQAKAEQREDLIKKVEGKYTRESFGRESRFRGLSANAIYNQALQDVIKAINKL